MVSLHPPTSNLQQPFSTFPSRRKTSPFDGPGQKSQMRNSIFPFASSFASTQVRCAEKVLLTPFGRGSFALCATCEWQNGHWRRQLRPPLFVVSHSDTCSRHISGLPLASELPAGHITGKRQINCEDKPQDVPRNSSDTSHTRSGNSNLTRHPVCSTMASSCSTMQARMTQADVWTLGNAQRMLRPSRHATY